MRPNFTKLSGHTRLIITFIAGLEPMFILLDSPLVCPVVIGRTDYLAALDNYIKASAAGKGRTLLLKGEAGVGKSRLVAEALARAEQAGLQSGQGQCFEYQPTPPFAPLLEILGNLL